MENNFFLTDDILWDYADGFLSGEEKSRADACLARHPEWRERLELILEEKRAFRMLPLETPKPGFSDRVMAALASEQVRMEAVTPAKRKDWIIYVISAVFGLFILTALIMTGMQSTTVEIPVELPQLPDIDWQDIAASPMLQYGLYLVMTLLALKVLDKYFHQRQMLEKLKMQG